MYKWFLNVQTYTILELRGPFQVRGVTISQETLDGSPYLIVSWTAVPGSGITYTVCYSTSSGTTTEAPLGAIEIFKIFETSTILMNLWLNTTYHIWIAAVSGHDWGPFSYRISQVIITPEGLVIACLYVYIIHLVLMYTACSTFTSTRSLCDVLCYLWRSLSDSHVDKFC